MKRVHLVMNELFVFCAFQFITQYKLYLGGERVLNLLYYSVYMRLHHTEASHAHAHSSQPALIIK